MIDLGNELNGYGEGDENSDVPTGFAPAVPGAPYVIDGIGIAQYWQTDRSSLRIGDSNKGLHSIGRLADLQKGGFNTVQPPTHRAFWNIKRLKREIDMIIEEHDT